VESRAALLPRREFDRGANLIEFGQFNFSWSAFQKQVLRGPIASSRSGHHDFGAVGYAGAAQVGKRTGSFGGQEFVRA
jgi:hypothetical protein